MRCHGKLAARSESGSQGVADPPVASSVGYQTCVTSGGASPAAGISKVSVPTACGPGSGGGEGTGNRNSYNRATPKMAVAAVTITSLSHLFPGSTLILAGP